MPIDLSKMPKGGWIRREGDIIVIGAKLGESKWFNLFLAFFWTFGMVVFPVGIIMGSWFITLFGIPFFLVGVWLWHSALMSAFGHIEIRLDYEEGTIFSGIGVLGRTRRFQYKHTEIIEEYIFAYHNDVPCYAIRIEGLEQKTIKFGGYMKDEKRIFIIEMLRTFLQEGNKVRDLLPPDLMKHLIS